jgi:hypothetical protein
VTKTVNFANGGEIPVIGFGTWQIKGQTCVDAVRTALRSDYRHVDTATMYGNEAEVGAAWQDSGLPRDDVFLTTKLPPRLAGKAHRTLEQSLRSLGTDHVDLWLIHWPPGGADASAALWAEFIKARDAGLTRYIGVSNYSPAQIDLLVRTRWPRSTRSGAEGCIEHDPGGRTGDAVIAVLRGPAVTVWPCPRSPTSWPNPATSSSPGCCGTAGRTCRRTGSSGTGSGSSSAPPVIA